MLLRRLLLLLLLLLIVAIVVVVVVVVFVAGIRESLWWCWCRGKWQLNDPMRMTFFSHTPQLTCVIISRGLGF